MKKPLLSLLVVLCICTNLLANNTFAAEARQMISSDPGSTSIVAFNVFYRSGEVNVSWKTQSRTQQAYFEIERSLNGKIFSAISKVDVAQSASQQYVYVDKSANQFVISPIYYRLKQVDKNGNYSYTNVITAFKNSHSAELKLWPNPSKGQFQLTLDEMPQEGNVKMKIYSMTGKLLKQEDVLQQQLAVNLPEDEKGLYIIDLLYPDNRHKILKALVQ